MDVPPAAMLQNLSCPAFAKSNLRNGRLKSAKPLSFSASIDSLSFSLEIACPLKTTAIASSPLTVVS
jgi:hypothetical protein